MYLSTSDASNARLASRAFWPVFYDEEFSIAYIQTRDAGYISRMRFTAAAGNPIQLGYWATNEYSISVSCIWGFVLAIGSRGIQAVKCLTGSNTTSCWLGCPDGSSKRGVLPYLIALLAC